MRFSEVQARECITPLTNLRLFVSSSARDRASKTLRCAVSFAWRHAEKSGHGPVDEALIVMAEVRHTRISVRLVTCKDGHSSKVIPFQ